MLLYFAEGDISSPSNLTDAFDYWGYWKWLDALTDAAFYGTNRAYALGNTVEQTSMGSWSDGHPVTSAVRIRPLP